MVFKSCALVVGLYIQFGCPPMNMTFITSTDSSVNHTYSNTVYQQAGSRPMRVFELPASWEPDAGLIEKSGVVPMGRRKRQKKLERVSAKIGWILFEALAVFLMNYILLKMVS